MYSRPSGDGWPARIATRRSKMIVSCGSGAELIRTCAPAASSRRRCARCASSASASGLHSLRTVRPSVPGARTRRATADRARGWRPGGQVAGRADELFAHRVEQVPRPGDELRVAAHRAGLVIGHPFSLPAVSGPGKWQQPASSSPRPQRRGRL